MNEEDVPTGYPHPLIDTPVQMIHEIAVGLEPPHEIAARYGYSASEYRTLATTKWYKRALAKAVEEQEAQGFTQQMKMRVMAETLLVHTYHAAKASDSVQNKLDVAKYLAKIADMEPKPNQQVTTDNGFNIIINIPDYGQATDKQITVEGLARDITTLDEPKPGYVRLPVYTDDLSNGIEDESL